MNLFKDNIRVCKIEKVIFFCPFPPPINGMSNVNLFMSNIVRKIRSNCIFLNTSPHNDSRFIITRLLRIKVLLSCFPKLISELRSSRSVLYLSLSSGFGILYDLFAIILAKYYCSRIIIHHHGYKYILSKSKILSIINIYLKKCDTQIFLCNNMMETYGKVYNVQSEVCIMSNIWMCKPRNIKKRVDNRSLRVAYFSNLSIEKGVMRFFSLVEKLYCHHSKISFIMAGSIIDNYDKITSKLMHYKEIIDYIGPIIDEENKENFFRNIDCIVLPSFSEAEPLIIYESFAYDIPVISTNVGCIPSMIQYPAHVLTGDNFVNECYELIREYYENKSKYFNLVRELSINYLEKYNIAKDNNYKLTKKLFT